MKRPFFGAVGLLAAAAKDAEDPMATAIAALFAVLVLGAYIGINVAPSIGGFLARPLMHMYWPSEEFDRPQPKYGIPESKRAKGLYEEAFRGFEQIAVEYPGESKPYIQMIEIAVVDLHDRDRARAVFHDGLAALSDDNDKQNLRRFYDATLTRFDPKPDWLKDQDDRSITPVHLNKYRMAFRRGSARKKTVRQNSDDDPDMEKLS